MEEKKEPMYIGIEDVILNLFVLLWPDYDVRNVMLSGRTYGHRRDICKRKVWIGETIIDQVNYDDLPIYHVLLKGKREIMVKYCFCEKCKTIWFDYIIPDENSKIKGDLKYLNLN